MFSALLRLLHRPIYQCRLSVISELVAKELLPGDRVLDVGCGGGALCATVKGHPACPDGVSFRGLERTVRGGEPIDVVAYGGGRFPFQDISFEVVLIADVLHHEEDPKALMCECKRIAKRAVIVKDHKTEGLIGHPRVAFLDWAANHGYGIRCLFRYLPSSGAWREFLGSCGLDVQTEQVSMKLYPPGINWIFGRRLHYFAVCKPVL